MSRLLAFFLFIVILFSVVAAVRVPDAAAGECDDARVAFGAFADGLYDFAGSELEQFLAHYPDSKMATRARLVLVLCSLKTGSCLKAAAAFDRIKQPFRRADFKIDAATLQLSIAECFLRAGERRSARELFAKTIKNYGKSDAALRARFALARLFFAEREYAAVKRQLSVLRPLIDSKRAQSLRLDRQAFYWMAGLTDYNLKDYAAALPVLLKISDHAAAYSLTSKDKQDLYALIVESAWHLEKGALMLKTIRQWLRIPPAEIDSERIVAALQLTADCLRGAEQPGKIRDTLIRVLELPLGKADKIAVYDLLVAVDGKKGREKALKGWLEALISLHTPGTTPRIICLESLLRLDYQLRDYRGVVAAGRKLSAEKAQFWSDEKLYFPFIVALGRLNKCREILRYVPAKLPAYDTDRAAGTGDKRRLVLADIAGNCLIKLGRFSAAVDFYRSLYAHYKAAAVRIRILVTLHNLAPKIKAAAALDEWVAEEVMTNFSLGRREDEKLLKVSPELVILVAEHLFHNQEYVKALPALIWLDKLKLAGRQGERVKFLLAESCYRSDEPVEARVAFETLYAENSKDFKYLAALRLVSIYEARARGRKPGAGQGKLEKLYRDLLAWESDPAVKRELKRKLNALPTLKKAKNLKKAKSLKIDTTAIKQ